MTASTLAWALSQLDAGNRVAIASVVESQGSVPGKVGAKIAISLNGEQCGTVGGAGLEMMVIEHLQGVLKGEIIPGIERFQLRKEARERTERESDMTALNSLCGGIVTIVSEVLDAPPHVLLAGGGHCAIAIGKMAEVLDWKISVMDARAEFVDENMHPNAVERIHAMPEDFLHHESGEKLSRFSHILIMGHDWSIDQDLLLGLLSGRESGTINGSFILGTIGSHAKWRSFTQAAQNAGISDTSLDAVICPIGIDVNAQTPEEIAIAVCAQIIDQRSRILRGEEPIRHSGWRAHSS